MHPTAPLVDRSVLKPMEGIQSIKLTVLRGTELINSLMSSSCSSFSFNVLVLTIDVLLKSDFPNKFTTTLRDNFLVLLDGEINSPFMVATGIARLIGKPKEPLM